MFQNISYAKLLVERLIAPVKYVFVRYFKIGHDLHAYLFVKILAHISDLLI